MSRSLRNWIWGKALYIVIGVGILEAPEAMPHNGLIGPESVVIKCSITPNEHGPPAGSYVHEINLAQLYALRTWAV